MTRKTQKKESEAASEQDGSKKGITADFDTAISTCGFGKFNYLLLAGVLPMCCSQLWASGSTSFIVPTAECDLQLSEVQKGALSAALYAGNIIAGMVWGVIADKFGRKQLILGAFLLDFILSFSLTFVNAFWLFLVLKFFTGVIISAPNSLIYAYVAETHNNDHRSRAIMFVGFGFAFAGVVQPVLAYLVLPMDIPSFSSWRVFLAINSVPSLVSAAFFAMLPESPKFLFSSGQSEEGLRVLRKMYALNSGRKPSEYPISSVLFEKPGESDSKEGKAQSSGWTDQFKILLTRPYCTRLLLLVVMQVLVMLCVNSLRLWVPQLFAFLDQFDMLPAEKKTEDVTTVCDMISVALTEKPAPVANEAHCRLVSGDVYLRSLVIGAVNTFFFLFAGTLVRRLGHRTLVLCLFPLAAACSLSMLWVGSADWLMGLISVYTPLSAMTINALSVAQVDLFPTRIRAVVVSIVMLFGRIASLSGNLILPVVLDFSCQIVFYYLGGCLIAGFVLSWMIPRLRESD